MDYRNDPVIKKIAKIELVLATVSLGLAIAKLKRRHTLKAGK